MKRVVDNNYTEKKFEYSNENESTPLNPAILGVPRNKTHGIKLPINMLSNERQQLSIKIDERRKSRIAKLEARILAKCKAIKKSEPSQPPLPQRAGSSSTTENTPKGDQDKDSVFARLYRNSSSTGHPKTSGSISLPPKPGVTVMRNELKPMTGDLKTTKIHISKAKSDVPTVETQNKMVKANLILNNKHKDIFQVSSTKNKPMETLVEASPEKESNFTNLEIYETRELDFNEEGENKIQNEELTETVFDTTYTQNESEFIGEERNEIQNEILTETVFETTDSQTGFIEEEKNKEIQNEEVIETIFDTTYTQNESEFNGEKENEIQNEALTETVLNTTYTQDESEFVEEKEIETQNEVLTETVFETTDSQKQLEFIEEKDIEIEKEEVIETVCETTEFQNELEVVEEGENKVQDEGVSETVCETKDSQNEFVGNKNEIQNKLEGGDFEATPAQKGLELMQDNKELKETVSLIHPGSKSSQNVLNEKRKSFQLPSKSNSNQKPKPKIRRSISMLFHQKSRTSTISRTFSDQSLYKRSKPCFNKSNSVVERPRPSTKTLQQPNPKPVKSVSFVTPKHNSFLSSTVLRNQLEEWLSVHGHSSEGYRHLRCFGIVDHLTPGRVSKRSTGEVTKMPHKDYSLDESDKENLTPPPTTSQGNEKEVENWLKELYRLITELKYPQERCEEWLTAIKNKCNSCIQMSLYWECRAALDESKGDIQSAIDSYQTAITKGKDVESGGDSLASMFDKMVLEQKTPSKSKVEKGIDPKNIFKSTVIKFALQQKNTKEAKEEQASQLQNLVATPVRRSSRIRTPSKNHVVSSLKSLTPESREKIIFKPNMSFLE